MRPKQVEIKTELITALRDLLRAYDSLMPGLPYIAVQDYELINRAPIQARKALALANHS